MLLWQYGLLDVRNAIPPKEAVIRMNDVWMALSIPAHNVPMLWHCWKQKAAVTSLKLKSSCGSTTVCTCIRIHSALYPGAWQFAIKSW